MPVLPCTLLEGRNAIYLSTLRQGPPDWLILMICKFSRLLYHLILRDPTRWRSWLRHWATSRKVAGSIPDGVTGIFHWHPADRTMAPGSTQPLTEMNTQEYFLGSKGGRCVLLTLPPSCADCLEIWEPQPAGTLRVCPGLYRGYFTFTFTTSFYILPPSLFTANPAPDDT